MVGTWTSSVLEAGSRVEGLKRVRRLEGVHSIALSLRATRSRMRDSKSVSIGAAVPRSFVLLLHVHVDGMICVSLLRNIAIVKSRAVRVG